MQLALKIDVDTERGTKVGVPGLLDLLAKYEIPATFLFSLGPDNTGRAFARIFRLDLLKTGFLKKVSRTSVVEIYGWRTLLNGLLWPGPQIGELHADIMRRVRDGGHEVGIHCYDHIRWQDGLNKMNMRQVRDELDKARDVFHNVFGKEAETAGAAGWQANNNSLQAYDEAGFLYGSDSRGHTPYFPKAKDHVFHTLQIPTTLPTLDELLGRPEYPLESLTDHYLKLLNHHKLNVLTIHTELEGMLYKDWFESLLKAFKQKGVEFILMADFAKVLLRNRKAIPVCELIQGEVDGRSGTMAVQGKQ